jgi:eukaryotic-like serine/threonine-protein kinase
MIDRECVDNLFLAAVELPLVERSAFLQANCGGDVLVQMEVESLLAADLNDDEDIEDVVRNVAACFFDTQNLIGQRLGLYRIVREIGRGGMGSVYLAVRDDAEYHKEVAVKIVRRGLDTDDVLKRFRNERQILAHLEHPYIAHLFDGGSTPAGVPFFVMEYIEGRPVDRFCREQSLSHQDVCKLFLLILEAVSFAHRSLVVHRDLKPANILITADGLPKLLDFGVAKLLDGADNAAHTTMPHQRPFTPEYASPEQVQGLPITTSTDIYSLGTVLYELLVGKSAQQFESHTPLQIELVVCKTEITRPRLHDRSVASDLDNIVMKALQKDPKRRYHSADQFAEDVRRYLERRPVTARQDSIAYRFKKYLSRNWPQVAGATVVAISLIIGLLISIGQTRRANAQRRIAQQQTALAVAARNDESRQKLLADEQRSLADQQRALADKQRGLVEIQRDQADRQKALAEQRLNDILELANRALFDVHDSIASLPGSMAARRTLVTTTLDYLSHLEHQVGLDDKMRMALTGAYYKIAMIEGNPGGASLQDFDGAKVSLAKARELLLPVYKEHPNDPLVMTRWLEVQASTADLIFQSGQREEAAQMYMQLIPVAHRRGTISPCDAVCDSQEMSVENNLANMLQTFDPARSLEHADRGIVLAHAVLGRHPTDLAVRQTLGSITASVAGAYRQMGSLERAGGYYKESIATREELLVNDPQNNQLRRNLLIAYGNYAMMLGIPPSPNLGRSDEARIYAAKGVALARSTVAADASDATGRRDLAMILGRLGMVEPRPDGIADSLRNLEEAHALFEPLLAENPKSAETAFQFAPIVDCEGRRQEALGHKDQAEISFRRSMDMLQPFVENQRIAALQHITDERDLALLYASKGEFDKALELSTHTLSEAETYNSLTPHTNSQLLALAQSWGTNAKVQAVMGKVDCARQSAANALKFWNSMKDPGIFSQYRVEIAEMKILSPHAVVGP